MIERTVLRSHGLESHSRVSLCKSMAGKNAPERGRGAIHINDVAGCSVTSLQRVVGLVTQDDVLLGRCTVQEVLWFSARGPSLDRRACARALSTHARTLTRSRHPLTL